MFLHTYHPSPILYSIGPLAIHWYGLLLVAGGIAAYYASRKTFSRAGIPRAMLDDLVPPLVIAGFIGARLYHVANEWQYYFAHPLAIFAVWRGGLAIHGALLAGLAVLWWYVRRDTMPCHPETTASDPVPQAAYRRVSLDSSHSLRMTSGRLNSFLLFADLLVPGIALAQAIGRWGNYFNQELYGRPTDQPWGIPIDLGERIAGFEQFEFFHPTFLYESIWLFITFIILIVILSLSKDLRRMPAGRIFFLYLILAGAGRFFTEFLRIDPMPTVSSVRLQQLVSLIVIIIGMAGYWWNAQGSHYRAQRGG